jgi:D-alanine-D-alanine ligase
LGFFNQIWQQDSLIDYRALSCAGIAPYNGIVPVTANSRVLSPLEHEQDHHYTDVQRWVEIVGDRLGSYAPIRIDCRRRSSKQDGSGGPFYLFDVNLKPVSMTKMVVCTRYLAAPRLTREADLRLDRQNATGPGRPGRDDQASLVLMAAQAIGWDFTKLARNMLAQAQLVKGGNEIDKSSAGA